jgi:hypothetical protein
MSTSFRGTFGSWPYHPFLLAAHPLFSLLLGNVNRIPLSDVIWPLAVIEAATLIILLVCRALGGSWRLAGLYCLLIVVFLLFFQRFDAVVKFALGDVMNIWLQTVLWLALLLPVAGLIWRANGNFKAATLALNAATFVFLAVPVSIVGYFNIQALTVRDAAVAAANRPVPELVKPTGAELPDIWYIVLDRYARADVLRSHYDFDNGPFLKTLNDEGFRVLDQSTSNYQRTGHSLASTLNLDYLDTVTAVTGEQSADWVVLYRLLEDFKVWRGLKSLGYTFSHFGSWWTPTAFNRFADHKVNWRVTPTFQRFLWAHSLPGRLARATRQAMDDRKIQCERVAHKFEELNKLADKPSAAKFVFAHFLIPHPPFVLAADGTCLSLEQARARSRRDNYIDQVRYTNDRLLDMIRRIQAQSRGKAIIILQADEGPWPQRIAGDEHTLGLDTNPVDWTELSPAELREKMAIFHALYLPDGVANSLPPAMSPVNTFRFIFRHWFGADLPPLPDENFIYLDDRHVFTFQRVTEGLRE